LKFIQKNLIIIILLFVLAEVLVPIDNIYILQTGLKLFLFFFFIALLKNNQKLQILKTLSGIYVVYILWLAVIDYFQINDAAVFSTWWSISLPLMCYHIGYYCFGTKKGLENLLRQVYWSSAIYIIYFFTIQFFSFDSEHYLSYSGTFQLGAIRNKRIYVLSFFAVLLFFALITKMLKKKKSSFISLLIMVLIGVVFISFRRTAWGCLFIGIFVLLIRTNLKKAFGILLIVGLSFTLLALKFSNVIESQLETRRGSLELGKSENVAVDYRVLEYVYIVQDLSQNSLGWALFGDENRFHDRVFWWGKSRVDNSIHADIVAIIFSTGIFGLIFYLLIYYRMFAKVRWKTNANGKNKQIREYKTLTYALIIMNVAILFSGGIYKVPINGTVSFLFIGSLIGILNKNFKN
jgi:O-antigen ligase